MEGFLTRLSPVLRLTRITTAFAAVGNVWFVILWSRANEGEFLPASSRVQDLNVVVVLTAGAVLASGLFFFATALNDTLDVRRDRAFHPDRPIPAGEIGHETAVGLVALTLMLAILGAALLQGEAVLMCLLTGSAILFYHTLARYLPAVGLVSLGLIYAAHMMTPNVRLVFVWPVWLVMTHALLVGAVTHRLLHKRPALNIRMLMSAGLGWVFWSSLLLYVGSRRAGAYWPDFVKPQAAIIPGCLVIAFIFVAWLKARSTANRPRAAEKIHRYGAMWLTLYAIGWFIGQGNYDEAMILGGLALAGFLGMTLLREIYGLIEHPVGYRR